MALEDTACRSGFGFDRDFAEGEALPIFKPLAWNRSGAGKSPYGSSIQSFAFQNEANVHLTK